MCARPAKPVGDGSETIGVQDGTLCLQPSSVAKPSGLDSAQKYEIQRRPGLKRRGARQPSKATTVSPPRVGSVGPDVKRLQHRLNTWLNLQPPLPTDGKFETRTQDALLRFQKTKKLPADGIVNNTVWFRLLSKPEGSSVQSRELPQDVMAWSLEDRFAYGLERTEHKLPSAMRKQFSNFSSGHNREVTVHRLTAWAESLVFGIGRPVSFSPKGLPGQSAGIHNPAIADELKEFVATTSSASTREELDAATDSLTEVIQLLSISEFAKLLRRHEEPAVIEDIEDEPEEKPPRTSPPKPKKSSWIELQVIWEDTGEPVPGVKLIFTAPDGNQEYQTTNSSGKIRVEKIESGKCDIESELESAQLGNTLIFKKLGEPDKKKDSDKKSTNKQTEEPKRSGTQHIASIKRHKVKTGESLKILAERAEISWQQLAKFNWDTDEPTEINNYLYFEVGCTHKIEDGNNYIFHDSDDPGIVYIPIKWVQSGLATQRTHVIQVNRLYKPPEQYYFSM